MVRDAMAVCLAWMLVISGASASAEEGKVTLPLSVWQQHLAEMEAWQEKERPPIEVSHIGRRIEGVFKKGLFHADLSASFEVLDTSGHIRVPVLDGMASLGEVRLNGKSTSLLKQGGMYTVGIDKPGTYKIELKFFWGKEQDRFARRLHFRLPDAGATYIEVLVPEKDIEARLANGAVVSREQVSGGTRLKGNLDATGHFDLSWTRKLTHKAAEAVRTEARLNTLFTMHEALTSGVAVFDFSILEGETDRVDLHIPAGIEVVKVEGEAVLQWRTEPDGGVTVLLRYLVEDQVRVAVHFQYPVEPNKPVELKMPTPPDGTPVSGAIGVQAPAGLDVRVAESRDAEKLRDLPVELTGMTTSPLRFGFGFSKHPSISLAIARHEEVALTSTLIDEIQASTVVIEDGTEITKLKVRIRNNTEQYLTMHLPEGSVLTHSLIDGRPIRPAISADSDALLFPLRQSERIGAGRQRYHTVRYGETLSDISNFYYSDPGRWQLIIEGNPGELMNESNLQVGQMLRIPAKKGLVVEESSFVIELAYKRNRPGLGNIGGLTLHLPRMDVETMKVIWHLYFPDALTPLSFGGNLTQYSYIRYDPFRRIRDFLNKALFTSWAWAGGKYRSILKQRKVIYQTEVERKAKGEVVLAAFPLTGTRYRFKRFLLEKETPTLTVTYVARGLAPVMKWTSFVLAFLLGIWLIGSHRRKWAWIPAAVALVAMLFLAHYFLGVHRRILWGIDLALIFAVIRMRAGPVWNGFKELLHSPWTVTRLLTFRNLAFLAGVTVIFQVLLMFPLLLSSISALVLFFWWRRKDRLTRQEVAHA